MGGVLADVFTRNGISACWTCTGSELTKKSASWHFDTIWRRCSLVLFTYTHMVLPPDPPYVLCVNSVLTCCVHMLHALHTNKRVGSSSLMQYAYCGFSVLCYESSALHCSLLMVLCMHGRYTDCVAAWCNASVLCNCVVLCIIAWFICVLLCGVCSVCAQISLRKRGRYVARLWKLCTWLYSVERSLVATWGTTSVLCIVFCSAVCYSAWTVHRGWQSVCTATVLWIYTYSIVNDLHCYIFYGDFFVCKTMRVCYAWRLLAFFREMIRSRKGSPDKNCQLNIKLTRSHHSVPTTQSCRNFIQSMANTEAQWCLRSLEIKSVVGITSSNLVCYIGWNSQQW